MGHFGTKLAVAVRVDLGIGKGKIAVQVGHASVTSSELLRKADPALWSAWYEAGQCKIVVKARSAEHLELIRAEAAALGLVTAVIRDRGLTQVPPDTPTCVAVGPGPSETVDRVTGALPLL